LLLVNFAKKSLTVKEIVKMLRKSNNYSYDNHVPNGYVSQSFEPLPKMWSRLNEIIHRKKRIRFSNKITLSTTRDDLKLPNINSRRDSSSEVEPVVVRPKKSDSILTKASILRNQKIIERVQMFEMKNNINSSKKIHHHSRKKKEFFNDSDEVEVDNVVKFDLKEEEVIIDNKENIVKNETDVPKDETLLDGKQNDVVSVDGSEGSDSDSENVVDLKREMIKKRLRKAVLANKTISKFKENNDLLNIKRGGYDDEDDPFNNSRDADDEIDQPKSIKLKFGSSLSEDGNYTMLKCYEDMLCNDIQNIYPKINTNQMVRTKTSAFIRLPRKFKEQKKVEGERQINMSKSLNIETEKNEREKLDKLEINKHKIRVSKQLERAMILTDKIRQKKGQLVTLKPPKSENVNNIVNAYQMWTSNWKKIFV
jgi:hypothetical protein